MTTPRHARDTDNGRYYTHPVTGQSLVSVTNVLSSLRKMGLLEWTGNAAADFALDNLPEIIVRSRRERDALRHEIAHASERLRDKASNLGTRIHDQAEARLTGRALMPDDEAQPYVDQYLKFMADFEIDPDRDFVSAEATVANPALGYAGTLDLLVRLRLDGYMDGKVKQHEGDTRALWLLDIKTSAKRAATQTYPDNALQLAALSWCRELWLPDNTVQPMPKPLGCAVLNLRRGRYELIPLPTGDAEYRAFRGLLDVTLWLHAWPGNYEHRPVTPTGRKKPKRGSAPDAD